MRHPTPERDELERVDRDLAESAEAGAADQDRDASLPEALRLIARHELFAGVPIGELAPLVESCEVRPLPRGTLLLSPGQLNKTLYLLLEGSLEVHLDRIDSEECFVIAPGECTGEISAVDCQPATAYVVAPEASRVLVVPEAELWGAFLTVPKIARNFMRLFADRLRARTAAMQRTLERQLRYEHLQKELAIAQDIQLGILPRDIDFGSEVEIATRITPAAQVGGDFFDAFPVGDREYCVAIGDVSGKGVPAGLFMMRAVTLLRAELLKDQPLEAALGRLNAALCEDNPTYMFATIVVGILDTRRGSFRYTAGGHEPVILGEGGRAYRALEPPRGILVGVDPSASYEAASLPLRGGDVLVMYTDGVTEAMDPDGRLFSLERLLSCLRECPAGSAEEIASRISDGVTGFAGGAPQSDDITTVVLRYVGNGSSLPDPRRRVGRIQASRRSIISRSPEKSARLHKGGLDRL
jgi:sigma-B regulation protein RsbU (phosphoserine phosphatase)